MSPQVLYTNLQNIEKCLKVRCEVRCRIPTKNKGEFYVHLYKNNIDDKEHLAIVAGNSIHSKSLNEYRIDDTDEKRMIRGATTTPIQNSNIVKDKKTTCNCNCNHYQKNNITQLDSHSNSNSNTNINSNSDTNTKSISNSNSNININANTELKITNIENNINNSSDKKINEENNNKTMQYIDSTNKNIPLVRIHSECFTSETIYSCRCDCAEQLEKAMKKIQNYGNGVIIYLKQEGRNIGLLKKMMAYNLQDQGLDTVEANLKLNQPVDGRNYTIAARILEDLGISSLKLLTNNPDKIKQLTSLGINIVERIPMIPSIWKNQISTDNYSSSDSNSNFSNDIDDESSNNTTDDEKYINSRKDNNSYPLEPEKLSDLERYLQTKVECMAHDIPLPKHLIHTHTHIYHSK